ncbi:hypothetical protein [Duganella callida]|nr:hypothetical protein [Duganella callida]
MKLILKENDNAAVFQLNFKPPAGFDATGISEYSLAKSKLYADHQEK